ncbi:uncharacterized protein LOC114365915 [Ostrinia furnacalis]|uniref:uncharacterized protein LOC114365915 n=1 Tax=Ostrinia furnacalis TaxID=93504 RepID=UPI001040DC3C|nr:uncharacterized protein LOC114365915 [Ostrinia furnacalis]
MPCVCHVIKREKRLIIEITASDSRKSECCAWIHPARLYPARQTRRTALPGCAKKPVKPSVEAQPDARNIYAGTRLPTSREREHPLGTQWRRQVVPAPRRSESEGASKCYSAMSWSGKDVGALPPWISAVDPLQL